MTELQVHQDLVDDAVVVRADGVIAMDTAVAFVTALTEAVPRAAALPPRLVVIELTGVTHFASVGVNAVVDCHNDGAAHNVDVRVIGTQNRIVRRVMAITGVDAMVAMYRSLPDALDPTHDDDPVAGLAG